MTPQIVTLLSQKQKSSIEADCQFSCELYAVVLEDYALAQAALILHACVTV